MSQPVHPHHSQIFLYFVTCGGVGCCGVSSQWYQWWEELEQMVNYWSLFLPECWASSLLFSNITSWSNKEQNMCWATASWPCSQMCWVWARTSICTFYQNNKRNLSDQNNTHRRGEMSKTRSEGQIAVSSYAPDNTTTVTTWSNTDYYYYSFIRTKWNARHLILRSGQLRPGGCQQCGPVLPGGKSSSEREREREGDLINWDWAPVLLLSSVPSQQIQESKERVWRGGECDFKWLLQLSHNISHPVVSFIFPGDHWNPADQICPLFIIRHCVPSFLFLVLEGKVEREIIKNITTALSGLAYAPPLQVCSFRPTGGKSWLRGGRKRDHHQDTEKWEYSWFHVSSWVTPSWLYDVTLWQCDTGCHIVVR